MEAVENAAGHKYHPRGARGMSPVEKEIDLASDHIEGLVRAFVTCGAGPPPGGTVASTIPIAPPVSAAVSGIR
jgi:hypothetical protein